MTPRRWIVPLSAAVVVAGVTLLAVWLAGGDSPTAVRSGSPRVLHLASAGSQATMSASSTEQTAPGAEPYKLTGTLPTGTPDDQPVWRLRAATAHDAQLIADALELSGTPTRVKDGWVLRDGDNRLAVRDDGSWSYGMDCSPDTPVSDEDLDMGCAATSGVAVDTPAYAGEGDGSGGTDGTAASPEPVPMPTPSPGPTDAEARSVAGALFDRLGFSDPTLVVYSGDPMSTVQGSPSVGVLQTSGWSTTVQVDGSGAIVTADGWLSEPDRGADYPAMSAQDAFDRLQSQPRPAIELCAQRPDGKPGCADMPPTEVTGATLGLSLDHDGEAPVLVPAWLFTIKGQQEPVAQIAVQPRFIGAAPVPDAPDQPMTGGASEPGDPGQVAPGQVDAGPSDAGPSGDIVPR